MIIYLGKRVTFEEMLIDLREVRKVDVENSLSDEFLIDEAYNLEEWEYEENI